MAGPAGFRVAACLQGIVDIYVYAWNMALVITICAVQENPLYEGIIVTRDEWF